MCDKEIIGRYQTNAWGQTVCLDHENKRCYSCDKFILPNEVVIDDGRCLCSSCMSVTVCLPSHIEWAKKRVYSILQKHGVSDIPLNVPVSIVSPRQMKNLTGKSQIDLMQPGLMKQTVVGIPFFQKRRYHIYIFNMMSRLHFAGVLAHELLHIWIKEKMFTLKNENEEGLCNLGSYLVYKSANSKATRIHLRRLEENPDPVYGDGYRKIKKIYTEKQGDIMKVIEALRF